MAKAVSHGESDILETGDIFFLYRPRIGEANPRSLEDVERFLVVLKPEGRSLFRILVVGRKYLPDIEERERNWGFVEAVLSSPTELHDAMAEQTYETKTRGIRTRPAARPAGEGVYALIRAGRNMHLAYGLELPRKPGQVQDALGIGSEGGFALSIKNPQAGSPPGAGLPKQEKADYPKNLRGEFAGRRFAPADPRLLDYPGAEFILIGANEDVEGELDVDLKTARETEGSADILKQLRLERGEQPRKPLFEGRWE